MSSRSKVRAQPSIVSAIIDGNQSAHLTARFLQNLDGLPLSWVDQDALQRVPGRVRQLYGHCFGDSDGVHW